MLTLKRFIALAESYGADLARWPDGERGEAEALLKVSEHAQKLLDEAQILDDAIAFAQSQSDTRLWPADEQAAALARLRSGVASQIVSSRPSRRAWMPGIAWVGWGYTRAALAGRLDLVGLAVGSACSVVAGLLIGAAFGATSPADNLQAMLQAAPLHIFG